MRKNGLVVLSIICCIFLLPLGFFSVSAINANPAQSAYETEGLNFRVNMFESESAYTTPFPLSDKDHAYALFLPADCDRTHLRLSFEYANFSVNGEPVAADHETDAFEKNGDYLIETNAGSYSLKILSSEKLPSVFLNTESGSLKNIHADKNNRESGTLTLVENGTVSLDSTGLEYVKGRGNSSWVYNDKKSYNIKFEKKTEILGMKADKKWALISNNMDDTLLRNAVSYSVAQKTGLPFTVHFRYVDLYINGEYRGNYLFCEKISVGENRINIADLDALNKDANPDIKLSESEKKVSVSGRKKLAYSDLAKDPANITGGYLMEYDFPEVMESERSGFITVYGTYLTIQAPNYATYHEAEYVSSLYEDFEEALLSKDGKNSKGKHYSEYIDLDSFADGVLMKELTANTDIGHSSWYIFLPENEERFYMGPVWDFDLSMENATSTPDCIRFCGTAVYERKKGIKAEEKTFIELLCSHRDFIEILAERFLLNEETYSQSFDQAIKEFSSQIRTSAEMNSLRWGLATEGLVTQMESFCAQRIEKLSFDFSHIDDCISEAENDYRSGAESKDQKKGGTVFWVIGLLILICIASAAVVSKKEKKKKQQGKKKKKKKNRK